MIASLSVSRGPLYEMLSRANIDQIHLAPLEHVHQPTLGQLIGANNHMDCKVPPDTMSQNHQAEAYVHVSLNF